MSTALSDVDGHLICSEDQSILMVDPDAGVSSEIVFQHLNLSIRSLITISHHIFEQFGYFFSVALSV